MSNVLSKQRLPLAAMCIVVHVTACSDTTQEIGNTKPDPAGGLGGAIGSGGSVGGAQVGGSGGSSGSSGNSGGSLTTGGAGGTPTAGGSGGVAQPGTGGLGVTGGAAGMDGSAGTPPKSFPCNNPTPKSGGYIVCEGNWVHRPTKDACPPRVPRPDPTCSFGMPGNCTKDSDCTARPEGYCPGGINVPCDCVYPCQRDEDCQTGEICDCTSGACLSSTCTTDADCNGTLCADYALTNVCGSGFACQTPLDECAGRNDCDLQQPEQCHFTNGHRTCGPSCPPPPP